LLADVQFILFDMGGTLVDYPVPSWPVAIGRCLEGMYGFMVRPEKELLPPAAAMAAHDGARPHHTPPPPDTALPHRATMALRRMVRSLSNRTLPRMAEACARTLVSEARLFPDTLPALDELKFRGYRMGVVSNTPWGSPEYLWENQLVRFGLMPYFGACVFSSGVGFRKPDVRIFQAALDRLGAVAAKTLFVGDDAQADIVGAAGVGMRAAWLQRPHRSHGGRARRRAGPPADLRIRSLRELLGQLPGVIPFPETHSTLSF
jgi:putative hydrolase of the HAD superfamily